MEGKAAGLGGEGGRHRAAVGCLPGGAWGAQQADMVFPAPATGPPTNLPYRALTRLSAGEH